MSSDNKFSVITGLPLKEYFPLIKIHYQFILDKTNLLLNEVSVYMQAWQEENMQIT